MTITPTVAQLAGRLRPATPPDRPLKVFYWPADMLDGCFRYRIEAPADELRRLGHHVEVSQRMSAWAREEADAIIGQRISLLKPAHMWKLICQENREQGRRRTVFEVDDDLLNIDPRVNQNAAVFHEPRIRKAMINSMRSADMITVSTGPLGDLLRQFNRNVVVIPNAVRREALDAPVPARRGRDDGITIYGWQGSATHREDWEVARAAVGDILAADHGARLKFLGAAYPQGLPLGRGQVSHLDWTTDIAQHYKRVGRFDVSLAPLADTVFNRSKSGLRFIESAALGLPTICSDVPAYRPWVKHGVTGYLVSSRDEWVAAMQALADPGRRTDMGAAAKEASAAWTIEATAHRWVDAYRSLTET